MCMKLNIYQEIIMLSYVWQQGTNEKNSPQMMKFGIIGVNWYSSTEFTKLTPHYTSWLSEQLCYKMLVE